MPIFETIAVRNKSLLHKVFVTKCLQCNRSVVHALFVQLFMVDENIDTCGRQQSDHSRNVCDELKLDLKSN